MRKSCGFPRIICGAEPIDQLQGICFLREAPERAIGSDQYTDSDRVANAQHRVRAGVTITQALLRGRGRAANLADLQQARLDVQASEYEFRAFAESLTADVELAYWDFVLAGRELEIFESSLALAIRQRDATRERIEIGQTAGVEITAAEAELALRRQALIDAASNKEILRLRMIRLLNPGGGRISAWDTLLDTRDPPTVPQVQLDPVTVHASAARQWRPEIREAKLRLANRELKVVKTRNGLLPRLDFFVTLGKSGFADSFGRAASNLDGDGYDARLGLRAELPLGRRADNARHQQAELTREAAARSIENLTQIVELDVRAPTPKSPDPAPRSMPAPSPANSRKNSSAPRPRNSPPTSPPPSTSPKSNATSSKHRSPKSAPSSTSANPSPNSTVWKAPCSPAAASARHSLLRFHSPPWRRIASARPNLSFPKTRAWRMQSAATQFTPCHPPHHANGNSSSSCSSQSWQVGHIIF